MKSVKKSLYATALLSVFLLTACTEDENKSNVEGSQPNITQKEVKSKSESVEKPKDNTPSLIEGYKVGGDELNGYFQIPQDFANYVDVNTSSTGAVAFARGDQSFVITAQTLPQPHILATATTTIFNLMGQMSGDEVETKPVNINGLEGNVLHTYFSAQDYHLYAYVLEGSEYIKYISIEYYGTVDDVVRDNIINSYFEEQYGTSSN